MKADCGIEFVHVVTKSSAFALREDFGVESLTFIYFVTSKS